MYEEQQLYTVYITVSMEVKATDFDEAKRKALECFGERSNMTFSEPVVNVHFGPRT